MAYCHMSCNIRLLVKRACTIGDFVTTREKWDRGRNLGGKSSRHNGLDNSTNSETPFELTGDRRQERRGGRDA